MNELISFIEARLDADVRHAKQLKRLGLHLEGWGRPDRDLREVAAHRKILELHPTNEAQPYRANVPGGIFHPSNPYYCDCQEDDGLISGHEPCETKRILASIYSDHPDYRAGEWGL